MNTGTYIFSQVASLLPKRVFDGIVKKYGGDKYVKGYSCWNHLMVTMYGQLAGCSSLREKSLLQGSPYRDYNEDKNEKMLRGGDVDF